MINFDKLPINLKTKNIKNFQVNSLPRSSIQSASSISSSSCHPMSVFQFVVTRISLSWKTVLKSSAIMNGSRLALRSSVVFTPKTIRKLKFFLCFNLFHCLTFQIHVSLCRILLQFCLNNDHVTFSRFSWKIQFKKGSRLLFRHFQCLCCTVSHSNENLARRKTLCIFRATRESVRSALITHRCSNEASWVSIFKDFQIYSNFSLYSHQFTRKSLIN